MDAKKAIDIVNPIFAVVFALVHTCLVEHNNVYWGVWHDMRQRSR